MAAAAGSLGPLMYRGCFWRSTPMTMRKKNPVTEKIEQHFATETMEKRNVTSGWWDYLILFYTYLSRFITIYQAKRSMIVRYGHSDLHVINLHIFESGNQSKSAGCSRGVSMSRRMKSARLRLINLLKSHYLMLLMLSSLAMWVLPAQGRIGGFYFIEYRLFRPKK